jgi:hypothetical protein
MAHAIVMFDKGQTKACTRNTSYVIPRNTINGVQSVPSTASQSHVFRYNMVMSYIMLMGYAMLGYIMLRYPTLPNVTLR